MRTQFIVAVLMLIGLCSCARVEVRRITSKDCDYASATGVRFYRPWPYLAVTSQKDKDGNLTYQTAVVYLPKVDEEYIADVKPGWGTVDGSLKLADGWELTDLGSKLDSKIPETITAISGLITAAAKAAVPGNAAPSPTDIKPGLYKIDFDDKGFVSGLEYVSFYK